MGYSVARDFSLLSAIVFALCRCGLSASLSLANVAANQGQTVAAPIFFAAGGQTVAAVQFDLQWDPTLGIQVGPGVMPGQFFKVLYMGSTTPGALRCLVVGDNQNSLSDGAVVQLFITSSNGAVPGAAQISLTNATAASPTGDAIPIPPASATVQIQSGSSLAFPAESVLNAASLLPGAISPGEIITILGLGPVSPALFFNNAPAPIIYSGIGQINAIVPFGVDLTGPVDLQVRTQNQLIGEQTIPVTQVAPAIFTELGTGAGPAAALNEDFSANGFANPAACGSILMVYGTGFGMMQSPLNDGAIAISATPLASPVSALIGGIPADVLYAGAAPTLVAGLTQLNIRVPPGLPTNPFTPITLSIGGATTPLGITVSVR